MNINKEIKFTRTQFYIGGKIFQLDKVNNLDDLVDHITVDEFNVDERLPYWAEIWPSAIGLSRYLIKNEVLVKDKSVLELGCGLGLTSMVISTLNPTSLLVTDYEEDALSLTRRNYNLNAVPIPETAVFDWRNPEIEGSFQRIIASDIAYEERFFKPLIQVFLKYLAYDGLIILAEPNRTIAQKFFDLLTQFGFIYSKYEEMVKQDLQFIHVYIYQILKKR